MTKIVALPDVQDEKSVVIKLNDKVIMLGYRWKDAPILSVDDDAKEDDIVPMRKRVLSTDLKVFTKYTGAKKDMLDSEVIYIGSTYYTLDTEGIEQLKALTDKNITNFVKIVSAFNLGIGLYIEGKTCLSSVIKFTFEEYEEMSTLGNQGYVPNEYDIDYIYKLLKKIERTNKVVEDYKLGSFKKVQVYKFVVQVPTEVPEDLAF